MKHKPGPIPAECSGPLVKKQTFAPAAWIGFLEGNPPKEEGTAEECGIQRRCEGNVKIGLDGPQAITWCGGERWQCRTRWGDERGAA